MKNKGKIENVPGIASTPLNILAGIIDIRGYDSYMSRVSTTRKNFLTFIHNLTLYFSTFKFKNTGTYFFKPMGDGCLIIRPLDKTPVRLAPVFTSEFLTDLYFLSDKIDSFIKTMGPSRPEGVLTRVAYGHAVRVESIDRYVEYFGKPIDLCHRLLSVGRSFKYICHDAVKQIIEKDDASNVGFRVLSGSAVKKSKKTRGHLPDGLTPDDLKNLCSFYPR